MKFSTACPACGGAGTVPGEACRACGGAGVVQKTELISVRIPAGVDSGSRVRIPGKGNAGRNGGPTGDLYIQIEVSAHRFFRREGPNISLKLPITVPEATLGAKIERPDHLRPDDHPHPARHEIGTEVPAQGQGRSRSGEEGPGR